MKERSISPRTVEHFAGLLALSFLAAGLLFYALQEPQRILSARAAQLTADLAESMTIYAQNCAVCHGLAGEGIGSTPALNRPEMQSADPISLDKVISRGLYNTSMPAWSREDGGPLSDYQIGLLVTLIQRGDWQLVQDRVVNLGLAPLVPFSAQPDPALIELTRGLPDGESLAKGIETYAAQCVACHGPDGLGTSLAPALNSADVRLKDSAAIERTILNGVPGTLMAPWQDALSVEQVASLLALITHWDEVPGGAIPAPDKSLPVTEQSLQLGADLYAQSCSRCHGPEGQGTPRAPSLNVKGFLEQTNDLAMQQVITSGVPGTAMPAWGDRMTDAEIQAIVGFIRSWEPTAPQVATPTRGGGPWWSTQGGTHPGGGQGRMPSGGVQPGQGRNGP
jgi:mono/diheme cytochrome c family protein